ncbi:MAG TPA: hypothetical protein VMV49_09520, partial [Candidatus Deferrimicrobium sp.]|nr:hypothetical protein [Candidatus Deferrimicrobium sp.]
IKFHEAFATKMDYAIKALIKGHFMLRPSQEVLETIKDPRKSKKPKYDLGRFTEIKEKEKPREGRKKRKLLTITEKKEETEEKEQAKSREKQIAKKTERKVKVEKEIEAQISEKKKKGKKDKQVTEEPLELTKEPELKKVEEPIKTEEPLKLTDSINKIPGITKEICEILGQIGIRIIDDLVFVDPYVVAENIGDKSISAKNIKEWQKLAHSLTKKK